MDKIKKHEHCWHCTGTSLMCNPSINIEVCCHCGENRKVHTALIEKSEKHGNYLPMSARLIINSKDTTDLIISTEGDDLEEKS